MSVALCGQACTRPVGPPAAPNGYRSIVCAVELSPEADAVLQAAGFLAQAYRARICLLHMGSSDEHGGEAPAEWVMRAFEKASSAGGREIALDTIVRVLDTDVPEGIRRTAIEEAADLVVVGRGHQQGSLSRMWSHLYSIIRESPCPVLSV